MKTLAIALAAVTAIAPVAAQADYRPYAHRHVQQYHQPHYGHKRHYQPRYYQPRAHYRSESRRGATNAQVLGGLLALGLIANIYSNKKN